jgi:hypothetical protein
MTMRVYDYIKITALLIFNSKFFLAQTYPPPAGQIGSTAIHKDSSIFINWVSDCQINRGYQDISNTALGLVTAGDSSMVLGPAGLNGVVSLGDGGNAICTFQFPIKNETGFDFAVFENSFDDSFLELAFVEVSSDGLNFVRFPSHSLTDTLQQTDTFGNTDASKINNLAGKYRGIYGTPFDLQELATNTLVNINAVTHLKIIDVVGSVNKLYAKRDSHNNMINDPWPTPFPNGGFDLDAIGIIHQNMNLGLTKNKLEQIIQLFPNPANKGDKIYINSTVTLKNITLFNFSGDTILTCNQNTFSTSELSSGIYLIKITTNTGCITKKIIIL